MPLSKRKTILIVDDTPTNIGIISSVLKNSFKTKVATNGEKALVLASADDRPDLILLDITMPGMDGYEVCRRLKSNPATAGIPVIFLTAKTEDEDEKMGFEVGAVDYVHKPFSAPIMLARVETYLALQAALEQAREFQRQADELLHCLLPEAAAEEYPQYRYGNSAPLQRRCRAVLRRCQFCVVLRQTRTRGSGFSAGCIVRCVRAGGRRLRPGKDKDDRRCLHGGRGITQGVRVTRWNWRYFAVLRWRLRRSTLN